MAAEKVLTYVLLVLVLVGALNWGAQAAGVNLVKLLADSLGQPMVETVVYGLVALAAVGVIVEMLVRKNIVVKDKDEQ